ncbi:MAG: RNase adapter RapZ [Pseudomonadales bacterium]
MSGSTPKGRKLAIISGRSGSGKTTALHVLEDAGYYCIDNLPAALLPALVEQTKITQSEEYKHLAVCIDARNAAADIARFDEFIEHFPADIHAEIIYLDANGEELLKRFSETRRKHPLSDRFTALQEALEAEKELLAPIANGATLTIETSQMNIYELRDIVRQRVVGETLGGIAILFESFGFKRGIPTDADIVYDVRCLPNPYWSKELRKLSGLDQEVIDFLEENQTVHDMFDDIAQFLERWLPEFQANNRSYVTVGIGCTGGQHRSVYMSERLLQRFNKQFDNVQVRHRELKRIADDQ